MPLTDEQRVAHFEPEARATSTGVIAIDSQFFAGDWHRAWEKICRDHKGRSASVDGLRNIWQNAAKTFDLLPPGQAREYILIIQQQAAETLLLIYPEFIDEINP